MNDQDYIRRAVELADGIEFGDAEDQLVIQAETITSRYGLDILAAQLVRQADAVNCELCADSQTAQVWPPHGAKLAEVSGPDRTLNTIKAIVDSGVLTAERGHDE